MSAIGDFIDTITAGLDTLYGATHRKLDDPRNVNNNSEFILNRSYGWYLSSGSRAEDDLGPHFLIPTRELVVLNTVVNKGTERDIDIRETAEKLLFEDQALNLSFIESLQQPSGFIDKPRYLADGGIEFVFTEKSNFLLISTSYTIKYKTDITYCL